MRCQIAFLFVVLPCFFAEVSAQDEARPRAQRQRQQEQAARQREQQGSFGNLFRIPGVEFSEKQQEKVDALRAEYVPRIQELLRSQSAVFTPEQRQQRRQAQTAAREAGKTGQELREFVEGAVSLTDEQQAKRDVLQKEFTELIAAVQQDVRALLTEQQSAQLQRPERSRINQRRIPPTHADISYGPSGRNVMDVWLAESQNPAPVLVSIHGGGFRGGNKSVDAGVLRDCLESGISVVAITYRLSDEAIAPAQFHDSARAIQFIRHNAEAWNLDASRIAATGGSAGAGISLWLGFHNDLADPGNEDPVLRESTRLTCMAVYNGQTSYDPRFIRELFPNSDTWKHPALPQLFDVSFERIDNLPAEKYELFEEVSALPHLTDDDAPALLMYASDFDTPITNQGIGIHHPRFGKVLKDRMDPIDIECTVATGVRRGDEEFAALTMEFVKKHFGMTTE